MPTRKKAPGKNPAKTLGIGVAPEVPAKPKAEETKSDRPVGLAATMAKHRGKYAATVVEGKKRVDNGDKVASFLRGIDPARVLRFADAIKGESPGFHSEKYAKLNVGHARMNAGNVIRSALKGDEWTIDKLKKVS